MPADPGLIDPQALTFDALAEALRAQAKGAYAAEAVAELLIRHESWLRRHDFVHLIEVFPSFADTSVLMASVDWEAVSELLPATQDAAGDLAASGSERCILAVAASLAGYPSALPLDDLLIGLDDSNGLLVLRSLQHARRGRQGQPVIVAPFNEVPT
jgi:hypothetical protein